MTGLYLRKMKTESGAIINDTFGFLTDGKPTPTSQRQTICV